MSQYLQILIDILVFKFYLVLIRQNSSINWNENSVAKNREAGIIIENEEIALYYAEVFFYDRNLGPMKEKEPVSSFEDFLAEYKNPSFIVLIYGITFALVGRDWRKRKWT